MAPRNFTVRNTLAGSLALLAMPVFTASAANAALINYDDFSSTAGLTMIGSANNAAVPGVLQLTPASSLQGGAAYTSSAVSLGAGASFSTQFTFNISKNGGVGAADGITFFLAKSPVNLGRTGGTLGFSGADWQSVAIEFDTFDNGAPQDINGNHVAVDIHGSLTNLAAASPYGVTSCHTGAMITGCLADGNDWTATINYDGVAKLLNVTVFDEAEGYAFNVISNYSVDFQYWLGGTSAYVGFTGSTGGGYEEQDILDWTFSNTATLPQRASRDIGPAPIPEPLSLSLFGAGLAGAAALRRRKIAKA